MDLTSESWPKAHKPEIVDSKGQSLGNVAQCWLWREIGSKPRSCLPTKTVLENAAEDHLVGKVPLKIRCYNLPGYPRSTFLMVFSPDGTKVASTHGNHNIYVTELASGKHVRILKGHPRTPWCIAFHPSHPQLIGSGCLGGQVRVWDLSGGSESWTVNSETVIASIAFHPRDQLLVIATSNELYFWDWSQPAPFSKVTTNNTNEKVRYVSFDPLGHKLITGISVWSSTCPAESILHPQNRSENSNRNPSPPPRDRPSSSAETASNANGSRSSNSSGMAQELIVTSYQNLVQRYDSLVRNYHRLHMQRSQNSNTTDRGTDPMDVDVTSPSNRTESNRSRSQSSLPRRQRFNLNGGGDADNELVNNRSLSLDELSLGNDAVGVTNGETSQGTNPRETETVPNESLSNIFASRVSAFRSREASGPSSNTERQIFSNSDSNNGYTRGRVRFIHALRRSAGSMRLRNPFSPSDDAENPEDLSNSINIQNELRATLNRLYTDPTDNLATNLRDELTSERDAESPSSNQRPRSSENLTSEITQSLDIIRDILRDSGTRLLNLISDITAASTNDNESRGIMRSPREVNLPRRLNETASASPRPTTNVNASGPTIRIFSPQGERESSESETDSNPSLEVNIYSTTNSSFQSNESNEDRNDSNETAASLSGAPTNRMVVDLNLHVDEPVSSGEAVDILNTDRINITVSNNHFRVRTNAQQDRATNSSSDNVQPQASSENLNRPSTSSEEPQPGPSGLPRTTPASRAFDKVKQGIISLQEHFRILTQMSQSSNVSIRALRSQWDHLRRRLLLLHRFERSDRSFNQSERSQLISQMARGDFLLPNPHSTSTQNAETSSANETESLQNEINAAMNFDLGDLNLPSTSRGWGPHSVDSPFQRTRQEQPRRAQSQRPSTNPRACLVRRRVRRRARERLAGVNCCRHAPRAGIPRTLNTRENAFTIDIHVTRYEIRLRAMQILSIMFNMMMGCLEERELSSQIITMLRTLKKSLGLTWLILLGKIERNSQQSRRRSNTEPAETSATTRSTNETLPTAHASTSPASPIAEPVPSTSTAVPNADLNNDTEDSNSTFSSWSSSSTISTTFSKEQPGANNPKETSDKEEKSKSDSENVDSTKSQRNKWSSRLAVQISAANRNDTVSAKTRRDIYNERRRLKALHRNNPSANPINRRRQMPPLLRHRIPTMPRIPRRRTQESNTTNNNPGPSTSETPFSGFRTAFTTSYDSVGGSYREAFRASLQRLAQFQTRIRRVPSSRYRIRLYTPSRVTDMLELIRNDEDESTPPDVNDNSSPPVAQSRPLRRPLVSYRPRLVTVQHPPAVASQAFAAAEQALESILFNANASNIVRVNEPMHAIQVNLGDNDSPPRGQDYLQPIFFAHNGAMMDDGAVSVGGLLEAGLTANGVVEALSPAHRVQAWDLARHSLPNISDSTKNVVVNRCKIHNDASIDISRDGKMLVALLPVDRMRNVTHKLGIYSLDWNNLGDCLHTTNLEQNAVSVALSPCGRHLAVGLGSRRVTLMPNSRNNVFAVIFRLANRPTTNESGPNNGLLPVRILEQDWEHGFTSLNCLRWAPHPGQGIVLANNTGQLIIMS